jgi:hypothetical protein
MLALVPDRGSSCPYVMVAQALSGIAKDLTKMSSKSAVKLVVPSDAPSELYRWVALLTGSKNALKGVGFFLGGLLLTLTASRPRCSSSPCSSRRRCRRAASCAGELGRPTEGQVRADVLQQPRGQRPGRRADLPVRLARRVVRRRPPGLPAHGAGLELLAGRGHSWRSG